MVRLLRATCITMRMSHFFFFFKQKTAYEITRRDWSSDVCSSDLVAERRREMARRTRGHAHPVGEPAVQDRVGAEPLQQFDAQRERTVGCKIEMLWPQPDEDAPVLCAIWHSDRQYRISCRDAVPVKPARHQVHRRRADKPGDKSGRGLLV